MSVLPAAPSFKYLYERLGAERFQKLCAALVVSRMSEVEVFPTGQGDGGRDITAGRQGVVLQVKFTKDRIRSPVAWLTAAIKGEDANIRRLVKMGCQRYILMTNIEGSAAPGGGDRDRLNAEFAKYEGTYGIPMSGMWCSDIDAWVDLAGPNLKLAYVDMLTGSEQLVALLQSTTLAENEEREKRFLQDYVATQWSRDRTVKFTQIELRSNLLTDLFVDVTASRLSAPKNARGLLPTGGVGGLAAHLLSKSAPPFTLLEGVPGQGKSTASQYICQAHRVVFLDKADLEAKGERCPKDKPEETRLPIRIDLADYALWCAGIDPLAGDAGRAHKKRARTDIELFLVKHFQEASTDGDIRLSEVRSLLDRLATVIVFDGLDEVADPDMRATIVREIDEFISRRTGRPGNLHVVITTRPNSSGLAEPSPAFFQRLRLDPLGPDLRKRYLRQWAAAQDLDKPELRSLEKIFDERTAAAHVAQLANNPMQLALLLHLIRKKRDSLPTARTDLYRQYMDLFLEREVEKSTEVSPLVKKYRDDIEEASAYIGWYMQGRAEIDAAATRLSEAHIIRTMRQYLATLGRTPPVQEIFEALHQRVWVLTSKQVGTYEFDVQSIREYVTARFLHDYAETSDGGSPPRSQILSEMLWRPYWANTARFLAGHFTDGNLADLADDLIERLQRPYGRRQARATMWSLLADGVFKSRPRPQERIAKALADDTTVKLLYGANTNLDKITPDYGGKQIVETLLDLVAADPTHPATAVRCSAVVKTIEGLDHREWWLGHMTSAAGTAAEDVWLQIGYSLGVAQELPQDVLAKLRLDSPEAAGALLASGVAPAMGHVSCKLLEAVLDGWCSEYEPSGSGEAANLLTAFSPKLFLRLAKGGTIGSDRKRALALDLLQAQNPAFERVARAARGSKNTKGTTSRWVDAAVELAAIYGGPRWLFTEIASTSLLLDPNKVRTGGAVDPNRPAFGSDMHYGTWVSHCRTYADKVDWWRKQRELCSDEHSRATWALAVMLTATGPVVGGLIELLDETVSSIGPAMQSMLLSTSERLGQADLGRKLTSIKKVLELEDLKVEIATRLLLAHHSDAPERTFGNEYEILLAASQLSAGTNVAAGAATLLAAAAPTERNLDLVKRFPTTGNADPAIPASYPQAATCILNDPGHFPVEWVLQAEHDETGRQLHLPLRTHAENAWDIT